MATDTWPPAKYWNASWNFVYGCTLVGEGCKNCWAKANHERWRSEQYPLEVFSRPFNEVCVFPGRLKMPLGWKKPRVVAVCFSGDPLHEKVPDAILDQAFAVMALCPQHTFIILTKRWERMAAYVASIEDFPQDSDRAIALWDAWGAIHGDREDWRPPLPLSNLQLGVSVSTQAELDAAMPHLLATPAAVRLLSLEPLLEEIVFGWTEIGSAKGGVPMLGGIEGIIIGCETGPNRRPCPVEYIERVVGQAQDAGVPIFVKAVNINGRVSTNPAEWPESIRFRELPK